MSLKLKLLFIILLLSLNSVNSQETKSKQIHLNQKTYPLYPELLQELPDIPSPFSTADGEEIIIGITKFR